MRNFEQQALQEIAIALRSRFNDDVILYAFGSRVRGDNTMDSDFDLLVIIENKTPDKEETIVGIIVDIEMARGCSFSPVIKDTSSFAKEKKLNSPFYQNIIKEGIKL